DSTLTVWPDNRIAEDAHYVYRHDEYGRLTEKTDRIPAGVIRTDDERTHHYDSQHRLVFYTRIQHGEPQVESRYLYDPLGRRTGKRVWRRVRDLTGWMSLSRKPEVTWYGWDGDRLTTIQTQQSRIQTVYEPGSFTPLIRIETDNGEREKTQRRSLAEKLQQEGSEDGHGVVFPAELVRMLDRLEGEIRADRVSSESRQWLAQCGLTVEQLEKQVEPEYTPARKVHLYHCDHRGLPLALISEDGNTAWSGEYDEWGNLLNEENPHHLHQPYRLPGQQHDEESGLYYNRHRYYDPLQGRYIIQDPIGLAGGINPYSYVMNNPVQWIDPLGLAHTSGKWKDCGKGCRIRIDGDAVGDGRHLHWECKNGSGVMGEFGGMSHGEDYSSAPNSIKKCAKKYGFEPEPSKDLSCKTSGLSTTDAALATGATIGAGYVIYRVIRFIPSLAPPLWWSIPANVVTP
ncbi:RHS element protein, partial [Escherichia coli]